MKSKLQTLIKDHTGQIDDYGLPFAIVGIAIVYISIQLGMNVISDKLWNVFKHEIIFEETESSKNTFEENSQIALASLLLQVSGEDRDYSEEEIKLAYQILERNFPIKNQKTKELLKKALNLNDAKLMIDQFLNQKFTTEEKRRLFSLVWQMITADQKVTKKENSFALKLKKRLELSSKLIEEVKGQDRR